MVYTVEQIKISKCFTNCRATYQRLIEWRRLRSFLAVATMLTFSTQVDRVIILADSSHFIIALVYVIVRYLRFSPSKEKCNSPMIFCISAHFILDTFKSYNFETFIFCPHISLLKQNCSFIATSIYSLFSLVFIYIL